MIGVSNDFDETYKGTPPWDIGRPQTEFVLLEKNGEIKGSILDVGCGTGENTLFFAGLGHEVVGVDFAHRAIQKAQAKAEERKIKGVMFKLADALNLSESEGSFDNAIDCGLFHTFTDIQRRKFVRSIHSVINPNGSTSCLPSAILSP